jgi:hypothetical protein
MSSQNSEIIDKLKFLISDAVDARFKTGNRTSVFGYLYDTVTDSDGEVIKEMLLSNKSEGVNKIIRSTISSKIVPNLYKRVDFPNNNQKLFDDRIFDVYNNLKELRDNYSAKYETAKESEEVVSSGTEDDTDTRRFMYMNQMKKHTTIDAISIINKNAVVYYKKLFVYYNTLCFLFTLRALNELRKKGVAYVEVDDVKTDILSAINDIRTFINDTETPDNILNRTFEVNISGVDTIGKTLTVDYVADVDTTFKNFKQSNTYSLAILGNDSKAYIIKNIEVEPASPATKMTISFKTDDIFNDGINDGINDGSSLAVVGKKIHINVIADSLEFRNSYFEIGQNLHNIHKQSEEYIDETKANVDILKAANVDNNFNRYITIVVSILVASIAIFMIVGRNMGIGEDMFFLALMGIWITVLVLSLSYSYLPTSVQEGFTSSVDNSFISIESSIHSTICNYLDAELIELSILEEKDIFSVLEKSMISEKKQKAKQSEMTKHKMFKSQFEINDNIHSALFYKNLNKLLLNLILVIIFVFIAMVKYNVRSTYFFIFVFVIIAIITMSFVFSFEQITRVYYNKSYWPSPSGDDLK